MEALIRENGFHLPPFCNWTPEDWQDKGHEYDEIRDNMLGWDITDFGLGKFDEVGFGLVTLRNGNQHDPKYKKVYAEKLLFLRDDMMAPMHFHWYKSEDIINRGGGTLQIKVYNDDGEGRYGCAGEFRRPLLLCKGRLHGDPYTGREHHHLAPSVPRVPCGAGQRQRADRRGIPV